MLFRSVSQSRYLDHSEEYFRCDFIEPKDWLKVKLGLNEFYKASISDNTYYWSIVNGHLEILPTVAYDSVVLEVFGNLEDLDYTETDIALNPQYDDIIYYLACSEAYLDYGQKDWSESYYQRAINELKVIAQAQQTKEGKDEENN